MTNTATPADLKLMIAIAHADGYAAYGEDRPAAPAASAVVMNLVEGMAVGAGAADVFEAFTRGYARAANEECARILAED